MDSYFANTKIKSGRELTSFRAFGRPLPYNHTIRIDFSPLPLGKDGTLLWQQHEILCYALPKSGGWRFDSGDPRAPASLRMSADYGSLLAWLPPCADLRRQDEKLLHLVRTAVETSFPFFDTISMHASCVATGEGAVAFTASSGVGKSTRARQWVDHLGALQLSGDRPAVYMKDGQAFASGVPWDGKEQIFIQAEAPLRAICEVRRAPFQRLRRLSVAQARKLLVQQTLLPMWDEKAAAAAIGVIERLLSQVAVYRLFGGPDKDLALFTHDALMGANHHFEAEEARPDMKIRDGFVLRNVVDEHIVMPVGKNIDTFDGVMVLNEVSAFIWGNMQKPIGKEDLLALILAEFDVDEAVARADLDAFLQKMSDHHLLEEELA